MMFLFSFSFSVTQKHMSYLKRAKGDLDKCLLELCDYKVLNMLLKNTTTNTGFQKLNQGHLSWVW